MKYLIEGRNLELLRIDLESEDDAVVAEAGKMVYMNGSVEWSMAMPGRGISGKLAGAFRRKLAGESILMTRFAGPGEVGFAGDLPGTIRSVDLDSGAALIVRRGGFLASHAVCRAVDRVGQEAASQRFGRSESRFAKAHRAWSGVHPRLRGFRGVRSG